MEFIVGAVLCSEFQILDKRETVRDREECAGPSRDTGGMSSGYITSQVEGKGYVIAQ